MKTQEYRTVDKSTWARGEWDREPDKVQWPDPITGLPCLIVRGPAGALCGYVGVPDTHPWHSKDYNHSHLGPCSESCDEKDEYHYGCSPSSMIEVHGGLTFSDACAHGSDEAEHICHVPDPGEPDNVWWFGFDCAHSGDRCPSYERMSFGGDYKNIDYVKHEVTRLAAQLAERGRV